MCNPGLTKHMQENPHGLFLSQSEGYLGLGHGDTETGHPYVRGTLTQAQNKVAQIEVKSAVVTPAALPSFVASAMKYAAPPVSWHAQYCLSRFGRTTPGA